MFCIHVYDHMHMEGQMNALDMKFFFNTDPTLQLIMYPENPEIYKQEKIISSTAVLNFEQKMLTLTENKGLYMIIGLDVISSEAFI